MMHTPDGSIVNAKTALESAGINPYQPQPREGLALVSHSSMTAGMAALGWTELKNALDAAQSCAALSMEGFRANLSPLDERVLALRPQPGQVEAAAQLRQLLAGSALFQQGEARRLQDPLSIRNIAQVHGSVWAMLDVSLETLMGELNGASDNPAVLLNSAEILSHGGYLPTHLTVTLNATLQACVHLAALQVARISKLLFERFSGLSNGLTYAGAEGAGLGPIMKPAETLYAEVAHMAAPSPIYPGISADGLEDVSTHAAIPVKNMFSIALRLRQLSAIEGIVAAQAIDLRDVTEVIAPKCKPLYDLVRSISDQLQADRPLGAEIDAIAMQLSKSDSKAVAT
jgi:histidine ammonia-lyase